MGASRRNVHCDDLTHVLTSHMRTGCHVKCPLITCHVTYLLITANYEGKAYIEAVVAVAPEAEAVPPSEPRRRPLIFVYDLPPEYVARMLQYKVHR